MLNFLQMWHDSGALAHHVRASRSATQLVGAAGADFVVPSARWSRETWARRDDSRRALIPGAHRGLLHSPHFRRAADRGPSTQ